MSRDGTQAVPYEETESTSVGNGLCAVLYC